MDCKFGYECRVISFAIVLIYPEWIVNISLKLSALGVAIGFNLSRVDCKLYGRIKKVWVDTRFNLSRVDCKSFYFLFVVFLHRVLIYPEWIVNFKIRV